MLGASPDYPPVLVLVPTVSSSETSFFFSDAPSFGKTQSYCVFFKHEDVKMPGILYIFGALFFSQYPFPLPPFSVGVFPPWPE